MTLDRPAVADRVTHWVVRTVDGVTIAYHDVIPDTPIAVLHALSDERATPGRMVSSDLVPTRPADYDDARRVDGVPRVRG